MIIAVSPKSNIGLMLYNFIGVKKYSWCSSRCSCWV